MSLSRAARVGLLTCLTLLTSAWTVAKGGGGGGPPADPAIVFVELGGKNTKLSVMNADGAKKTVIYSTSALLRAPCWSASGDSVCFGIQVAGGAGLAVLDVDVVSGTPVGSNFMLLASGNSTNAAWSPDGATIAFSNDAYPGIWSIPATGGTPTQLLARADFGHGLAWSPDGSQIAFIGPPHSGSIEVLDIAGGSTFTVCTISDDPVQVDWGRTGNTLVFHASAASGNGKYIYTVDAAAGAVPVLVTSSSWFPTWSPDDSKIAYTTGSGDGIVVRDMQTGKETSTGGKGRFANWRRF